MHIPGNFHCLIIRTEGFSNEEKQHIIDVYTQYGRDVMYEHFKTKKILPFAAKTFCNLGIDTDFWQPIIESYRDRNRKVIAFLDAAYKAMKDHGVKKVFLSENFGALLSAKNDIGLFASGDTDNCYAPEEYEKICDALESIGCKCKRVMALNRLNSMAWYPPERFGLPDGFYMGLQPKPLSRLFQPSFVDMDDFDGWDNMWTYKDTAIQIANHTALMYICMLHISLHSFSRAPDIRLYIDLLNMAQTDVDYDKIIYWCNKNHTKTRVSVAATIANELMGTNIPESVTDQTNRKKCLLKLVYDEKENDLIYEPQGLKTLEIELKCHDRGMVHGLLDVLFPDSKWMKETYGSSSVLSCFKHIFRLL